MEQSTRPAATALFLATGLVIAIAALPGCGTAPDTSAVPATSSGRAVPAGPRPTSSAVADNPPGALTCAKLAEAIEVGSLMDPGVVDGIFAASDTADAPVADAARRLVAAYVAAAAAKGGEGEPDAVAAVSAAAADMASVCGDSGLRTVG